MTELALAAREREQIHSKPGRMALRVIMVTQLLTAEQLAFYLQQEVVTVYAYVRRATNKVNPPKNPIPFRKLGSARNGSLRFDFDEIVAWTKGVVE